MAVRKLTFTLTWWVDFKLIKSKEITIRRSSVRIAKDYLYRKYSPSYCEQT